MNIVLLHILVSFPYAFYTILIVQLIKNSITGKNEKVTILIYISCSDLRNRNNNVWVPSIPGILSFYIPKCSTNTETAWVYSQRSGYYLIDHIPIFIRNFDLVFRLVYLTSVIDNAIFLYHCIWPMVIAQIDPNLPMIF